MTCHLERLRLHNFRNYAEITVEFDPGLNVITGRNAQGKTNLVEAIACMAMTRSPRASSAAELVRWGELQSLVSGTVIRVAGTTDIEFRLARETVDGRVTRSLRVDSKPRHARDVLGLCPVVLFSPDDLQLVKAGPDGRRRRLDAILSQTDKRMASDLLHYRRAVDQRNALLRHGRVTGIDLESLDSFTRELIEYGSSIRAARVQLVHALSPGLGDALQDLSRGTERAELRYVGGECDERTAAADELQRQLGAIREEEIARGVSLAGPHRDDVEVVLDSRPARTAASQGQQRSIVLALALAEVRHMQSVLGVPPLVLLDDVLSELDRDRRSQLLTTVAETSGVQMFVTTSEPDVADNLGVVSGRKLLVVKGRIDVLEKVA